MVESLRSVILKSAEYIIRCSMFISFIFDQTGRFFWPEAALVCNDGNILAKLYKAVEVFL